MCRSSWQKLSAKEIFMTQRPILIKKEERKIIFRVPELADITDALVDRLAWPKNIPLLWLKVDKGAERCHEVLKRNVSRKYETQIIYSVPAKAIRRRGPVKNSGKLEIKQNIPLLALRELYMRTQAKDFVVPWAEELDHRYFEETANFIKDDLPVAKSACLYINNKPVGQLIYLKLDENRGLVAWIWIDSVLAKRARAEAHDKLLDWLRKRDETDIKCVINEYNVRSNRFFQNVGFLPECVAITRRVV